jgi:uncharacterized protein involved in exopolysaccharide biosynthesis
MTKRIDPAQRLADSLENPPDISIRTLVDKFLLHWKLFAACTLVAPAIAVGLMALVPITYKASAQIVIEHAGGAYAVFGDAVPDWMPLSGATMAELVKSAPVVSRMIKTVGVVDADIARPAYKVLLGRVMALVMPLFGRESADARLQADPDLKYRILADDLKPSIDATTLLIDRGGGMLHDEVVEINLKANTREKVAAMVNGLCAALIAETDLRRRTDLQAAAKVLDEQAASVAADLEQRRANPAAYARAADADNEPLAAGLARSISDLDVQLATLRQTFADSAPEVTRVRGALAQAREQLARQETIDATTEQLGQIRRRQRQIQLALQLVGRGEDGLTVAETALTPKKTKLVALMHFGLPAAAGLIGGMFVGGLAVLLLNLLDPRLFVAADVEPASSLRVLGCFPAEAEPLPAFERWASLPHPGARPVLLQVLGRREALGGDATRVLAVTSALNESASGTVALQLAALLARDHCGRVLLVDANADRPSLAAAASAPHRTAPGDRTSADAPAGVLVRPPGPNDLVIGAGRLEIRGGSAPLGSAGRRAFAAAPPEYAAIVLHLPGLLNSRDAAALAKGADHVLVVSSRKRTRKDRLREAADLLTELEARVLGLVHCESEAG